MKPDYREEFIAKEVKVVEAKNKSLIGLRGRIIFETKNTFVLLTKENDRKKVLKQGAVFEIDNQKINGEKVIQRPEDRIKNR